jgi:hypothetical protein
MYPQSEDNFFLRKKAVGLVKCTPPKKSVQLYYSIVPGTSSWVLVVPVLNTGTHPHNLAEATCMQTTHPSQATTTANAEQVDRTSSRLPAKRNHHANNVTTCGSGCAAQVPLGDPRLLQEQALLPTSWAPYMKTKTTHDCKSSRPIN